MSEDKTVLVGSFKWDSRQAQPRSWLMRLLDKVRPIRVTRTGVGTYIVSERCWFWEK